MDPKKATEGGDDEMDFEDDTEHSIELESSLEKQDEHGKWKRVTCSLKEPRHLVFSTEEEEDHSLTEVADLTGYDVTQMIDQFQGKRFVLKLDHLTAPSILLSLDSRDDLALWRHAILTSLKTYGQTHKQATATLLSKQQGGRVNASADKTNLQTSSSSAQSIKQKLLAEMLRQREELQRMQAIRAEMKAGGHPIYCDPLVLDEDRIIALTRLRQRRMSTQIKLQTIQRQMESASIQSPRDKKSTFLPLGRKRTPDLLLQSQHAKDESDRDLEDSRTALEAQVKHLSSRLHDLDEDISNHEANAALSPRDEVSSLLRKHSPKTSSQDVLRHSLDPSCLPAGLEASLRDSVFLEDDNEEDLTSFGRVERYDSADAKLSVGTPRISGVDAKNRGKDAAVSNSKGSTGGFKSSVQKLAHRTFSKATNWNWATKKAPPASSISSSVSSPRLVKDGLHNNNNNTILNIKEGQKHSEMTTSFSAASLSDNTPDVVDMTSRASQNVYAMKGDHMAYRPRKSFDDSDINIVSGPLYTVKGIDSVEGRSRARTAYQVNTNVGYRTPKERILSKMANSTSVSGISRFEGRLQNFSSSSPDLALDDPHLHLHYASSSKDKENRGESDLKGSIDSQQTWRPNSLVLPSSTARVSCTSPLVTRAGSATSSTPSPRGSEGKTVTPRREVNPDALAQIEAFEELSLRYLGAVTK